MAPGPWYIYMYIYVYVNKKQLARASRALDSLGNLILMFLIGGGIAVRKQAVLLRPGGNSSMEYHLFVDLSRWRSISSEKRTQTPKAARSEQVEQESKRARATSDQQ